MSTLAYAILTRKREESTPGASRSAEPPGVRTWIDALSALVPTEVLTAHAILLSVTTAVQSGANGQPVAVISDPSTLATVFYALAILAVLLYVVSRLFQKVWHRADYMRMLIPGIAFVLWAMIQKTTAFDAAFPGVSPAARTSTAVIGAIVLGSIATILAHKADQHPPAP